MNTYKCNYKRLDQATKLDIEHIIQGFSTYLDPEYLTNFYANLLLKLQESSDGFPINRFLHSLQSGTLAYRDCRDDEYVVCALLHDVGEIFDPYIHDKIIATLLSNYISEKNYFILEHHAVFQGFYYFDKIGLDRNAREKFKHSIYYKDCIEFVEKYDNNAFDPTYKNMTLDEFKPIMMRVFACQRSKR